MKTLPDVSLVDQKSPGVPFKSQTDVIKLMKLIELCKCSQITEHKFDISFYSYAPTDSIDHFKICRIFFKGIEFAIISSTNPDDYSVNVEWNTNLKYIVNTINPSLDMINEKIELKNSFNIFESSIDHLEEVRNSITNFWI